MFANEKLNNELLGNNDIIHNNLNKSVMLLEMFVAVVNHQQFYTIDIGKIHIKLHEQITIVEDRLLKSLIVDYFHKNNKRTNSNCYFNLPEKKYDTENISLACRRKTYNSDTCSLNKQIY